MKSTFLVFAAACADSSQGRTRVRSKQAAVQDNVIFKWLLQEGKTAGDDAAGAGNVAPAGQRHKVHFEHPAKLQISPGIQRYQDQSLLGSIDVLSSSSYSGSSTTTIIQKELFMVRCGTTRMK